MGAKSTGERVRRAFEQDPASGYVDAYLDAITQNWREVAQRIRTTIFLLVLAMVTFQLLADAQVTELSLGPAKLTDAQPILQGLPAVVAYLFYEFVFLLDAESRFRRLHREIVRNAYPTIEQHDLELPLAPPTPSLWGENPWIEYGFRTTTATRLWSALGYAVACGLLLLGLGFEIYAFVSLFGRSAGPLTWVSFVFSSLMVIRTMALVVMPDD